MDTNVITWIFLGIFGLFIFFKFRKMLPFKQDARRVNFNQTINRVAPKENIIKNVRTFVKEAPEPEPVVEYEEKRLSRDDFDDTVEENQRIAQDMFGFDDQNTKYEDEWSKMAQDNADIANEMFGLGKKRKKKDQNDWEDYW